MRVSAAYRLPREEPVWPREFGERDFERERGGLKGAGPLSAISALLSSSVRVIISGVAARCLRACSCCGERSRCTHRRCRVSLTVQKTSKLNICVKDARHQ